MQRMSRLLPRALLGAALSCYALTFAWLLHLRHVRYGTFDFDLGIFDQNVWLLAHGRSFLTVRGLHVFGHHASFGHFLLVPFYWLGAGPEFLDNAMVAAVVLAAVVVFRLSARLSGSEWIGLVLALGFAWQPTTTWLLQETYHPEVMAIPALFLAFDAAWRRRWIPYALWLAVAVSFKEDVALAALMLGVLLVLRRETRVGVATVAGSLLYFAFVLKVLIPHYTPQGVFFESFYEHLGGSPGGLIQTALFAPDRIFGQLEKANASGYAWEMLRGYGFAPLLGPLPLILGLPQFVMNLLSQHSFTWSTRLHYASLVLVGATLATVEGVCLRTRRRDRLLLAAMVAACSVATTLAYGIGPGSRDFRAGNWPLIDKPHYTTLDRAVALPGPDDAVAATYDVVPHLSQRDRIYRFPNPWWSAGWGLAGENMHDPDSIDWLVLDRLVLGSEDQNLLDQLRGDPSWKVRLDEDDVLVLQRQRPGAARGEVPPPPPRLPSEGGLP